MAETAKLQVLKPEEIKSGMQVRVHQKIKELNTKGEEKERVQVFEGLVINIRGASVSRTMTVRKIAEGVGVERIYPVLSPVIDKVELVRQFETHRKHLGFVRKSKRPMREIHKA